MNIIKQDQRRLDNIANAYWKTSGDVREMWRRKWYELIKIIARRINENKRLSTDTGKIH
jgi:hypothetical protein